MSRLERLALRQAGPRLLQTPSELRVWSRGQHATGRRVGLVPTMGALHAGHAALLAAAAGAADAVVASVFVNPAQFGPGEDLESYPRRLEADLDLCAAAGAHAVYAPDREAVYGPGHSTWVTEDALSLPLEGAARPGHFRGVLTVVLKLINCAGADLACFGQKDIQQALLIRRLVRDLDVPVEIRVVPTVRAADGLALSSRNAYLSPEERRAAPLLYRALAACAGRLAAGERDPETVRQAGLALLAGGRGLALDYLQVVEMESLQPPRRITGPVVVAGAVRLGGTRLIDNVIHPPAALAGLASGADAP